MERERQTDRQTDSGHETDWQRDTDGLRERLPERGRQRLMRERQAEGQRLCRHWLHSLTHSSSLPHSLLPLSVCLSVSPPPLCSSSTYCSNSTVVVLQYSSNFYVYTHQSERDFCHAQGVWSDSPLKELDRPLVTGCSSFCWIFWPVWFKFVCKRKWTAVPDHCWADSTFQDGSSHISNTLPSFYACKGRWPSLMSPSQTSLSVLIGLAMNSTLWRLLASSDFPTLPRCCAAWFADKLKNVICKHIFCCLFWNIVSDNLLHFAVSVL